MRVPSWLLLIALASASSEACWASRTANLGVLAAHRGNTMNPAAGGTLATDSGPRWPAAGYAERLALMNTQLEVRVAHIEGIRDRHLSLAKEMFDADDREMFALDFLAASVI